MKRLFWLGVTLVFSMVSYGFGASTPADPSLCTQWHPVFTCSPMQGNDYSIRVLSDPASDKFGVCLYQGAVTHPAEIYLADGNVTLDGVSWLELEGGPSGIAAHLVTQEEASGWIGNLQFSGESSRHRLDCRH